MEITSAFRQLARAIVAEDTKIESIGREEFIGSRNLHVTDERLCAESSFEDALERFVVRLIKEKLREL